MLLLPLYVDKEFVIWVEIDEHSVLLLKYESEERLKLFLEPYVTVELVYFTKHFIIFICLVLRFRLLCFIFALLRCIIPKLVQLFVPQ